MLNRLKMAVAFTAGAVSGLMVAICTSVWLERPGSAGGEVLILPLIGLLLYAGYEFGRLTAMSQEDQHRRRRHEPPCRMEEHTDVF